VSGKLLIALLAALAWLAGPVPGAHADPYTPRADVQCTISVPPVVAGEHIQVKVGAKTNADQPATGTVTITVTHRGAQQWQETVPYNGSPTTVTGPRLIAGAYHVTTQFVPDNADSYRTCRGALGFHVGVGPENEHNGPGPGNGVGPMGGALPDTGGPDVLWLLLGTVLVGAGATSVVVARRRQATAVRA
jgi:hypothetical protein